MQSIHVASGDYEVLIGPGLLKKAGEHIACRLGAFRAVVVTDDVVRPLYADAVCASLNGAGIETDVYAFSNGERFKTLQTLSSVLEWFAGRGLTRSDLVVALGGGVVGDLAGFAAAVYMRGVNYIQIPTTLLAAVDSSVGGKTAVDLEAGKNLCGAFHQPSLVLCDTDVIRRLPEELMRDGAAEMIKTGILQDPKLFDAMADGTWRDDLKGAIAACVAIKRDHVDADERDHGVRQFLNLGHTFGHAIEKCSGFSISHGQGVAMGMVMAFRAAGLADADIVRVVEACGLPSKCPYLADELYQAATLDKKRRGGKITLVLPEKIGKCRLQVIKIDALIGYIRRGLGEGA